MNKADKVEMMHFFTEAFTKIVLPEFKEVHVKLDHLSAVQNEMRNQIDFLFKQYEKLEIEYIAIKQALLRIERKLDSFETSKAELEKEVKSLKAQMKSLHHRVAHLEKQMKAL